MDTIKINKFEINRHYYSSGTESFLFCLEERIGKELHFKVMHRDNSTATAAGTVKIVADKNGAQETVCVSGVDGTFTLKASLVVPKGRKLSECSPEEQARVQTIIAQDVENRKKNNIPDNVITEYKI